MNSIKSFSGEYRWLSNFYPAEVELSGFFYPTVEHAYQAAKTLDPKERVKFRSGPRRELVISAGEAKKAGRRLTVREDWEQVKVAIMRDLTRSKYRHPDLRQRLIDTGDAHIEEGNWWGDTFWGVCGGVGRNMLGLIIMEERSRLVLIHG